MLHGFRYMGVPQYILTDNMKSVVIRRDQEGNPLWQKDYEQFMRTVGFQTKLCKPRHPFTKGKVERLIRFVKENFLQNTAFHRGLGIPQDIHRERCGSVATKLDDSPELAEGVVVHGDPLRLFGGHHSLGIDELRVREAAVSLFCSFAVPLFGPFPFYFTTDFSVTKY